MISWTEVAMMMIPQQSRHTFANAAADKYNLCCLFLDWIVQCPFVAAYEKKRCRLNRVEDGSVAFTSIQKQERSIRLSRLNDEAVFCGNGCGKSGPKQCQPVCGHCRSINYCSAACQKRHWKIPKKDCEEHARLYRAKRDDECQREQRREQNLALHMMDDF